MVKRVLKKYKYPPDCAGECGGDGARAGQGAGRRVELRGLRALLAYGSSASACRQRCTCSGPPSVMWVPLGRRSSQRWFFSWACSTQAVRRESWASRSCRPVASVSRLSRCPLGGGSCAPPNPRCRWPGFGLIFSKRCRAAGRRAGRGARCRADLGRIRRGRAGGGAAGLCAEGRGGQGVSGCG